MKKTILQLGFSTILMVVASSASALALLGQEPDASKIYDAGNGLEWVYAAPCAAESPSCGIVMLHNNFRFATEDEWIDSFINRDGLIAAFDLTNYDSAICAAPEFNTVYNHCDPSDVISGYLWHAPVGSFAPTVSFSNNAAAETFLVRGALSVPEPSTLALMGLAFAGLGFRRNQKVA